MIRGTTPTLIFDFCNCIFPELADKILVTFKQGWEVLFDKDIDLAENIKDNKVYVSLTQEETLLLKAGSYVQYQMRLLINGGAFSTPIYKDIVIDTLNATVMTDGGAQGKQPTISGEGDFDLNNASPAMACVHEKSNEICASVGNVLQLKGDDGFSPTITVKEDSEGVYILTIKDVNGEYDTPNLKGDAVLKSEKGVPNGVATLDGTGHVPASQLPSFVDDVKEYPKFSDFPKEGEDDKIYVSKETNITYRWSGSSYIEISSSIALGETPQTAYAGNKGKKNADDIAVLQQETSALETKTDGIRGIYRFSESSVSSSFSGTTELYKEDLIGDGSPREGESVLFPDNKSNVMFIGTISHVNDETYTVDNIKYINDALKASGDWVMGVTANFPEMYNYEGGTWLCLMRDVTSAPEKGKEWFCVSEPAPVKSVAGKTGEVTLETKDITDFDEKITEATNDFVREQELGALAAKDSVGTLYIDDSSIINAKLDSVLQEAITKAGTAVQPEELSDVAKSGAYNDLIGTPSVPRPVYFKLNGDVMTDTGGIGTDYTLAISNLTPQTPAPIVGDVVIFNTSDNVYIGQVKAAQTAGITVTAKLQIGGTIL